jgi:predicted O-methyltransferase YrrM
MTLVERGLFKALRTVSPRFRAHTDLFVPPYDSWTSWSSGLEGGEYVLYALAKSLKPQVIVEIGSARGKSACAMALACAQNGIGKVWAIDPHEPNHWQEQQTDGRNEDFFRRRLKEYRLEDWCEVIVSTSTRAAVNWSRPIDLLFIDGDHSYEGVKSDFELFSKWLTPASIVLFHDSCWGHKRSHPSYRETMGVPRYLAELQAGGFHSVTLPVGPGLTLLQPVLGGFSFTPDVPRTNEAGRQLVHKT